MKRISLKVLIFWKKACLTKTQNSSFFGKVLFFGLRPWTFPYHLWPSTLDLTQTNITQTPKFGNIPSCQITKVLIFWKRHVWRTREIPHFLSKKISPHLSKPLLQKLKSVYKISFILTWSFKIFPRYLWRWKHLFPYRFNFDSDFASIGHCRGR